MFLPRRWKAQPRGPVQIDWNHPLSSGLAALWIPNWGDPHKVLELVSGTLDGTTGTVTRKFLQDGSSGIDFTSTSNYLDGGTRAINKCTGTQMSVMALIVPAVASRGDVMNRWVNGAGTGDQFNLLYGITSGKARFYTANGSGSTQNSGDGTTVMSAGTQYMLGGRIQGTSNIDVWVNGRMETQNTAGLGLMNAAPTTNYRIGDNVNSDGNFNGSFFFGAVWNYGLPPAAFREIYANPWQIVAPYSPRFYFDVVAAPPAATAFRRTIGAQHIGTRPH